MEVGCVLHLLCLLLAGALLAGLAPELRDLEDARVKTRAAVAATHGRAQGKKIGQIPPSKMRGTQIRGSAAMAMDGHLAFLLLGNLLGGPRLDCTIVTQNPSELPEDWRNLLRVSLKFSRNGAALQAAKKA
jgi:hypothetical protein